LPEIVIKRKIKQMTASLAEALKNNDPDLLAKVPKSDLHSHWLYGARIEAFEKHAGHKISRPPEKMDSVKQMVGWARNSLWSVFPTHLEHHNFALKESFRQASRDGVVLLEMSVDAGFCAETFNQDEQLLVKSLKETHATFGPNIKFVPELSIKGEISVPVDFLKRCFLTGYFGSLDLYAVEDTGGSYSDYVELFRLARKSGLKLKAHVGEFGPAALVRSAVEVLELDAVQHGISAADSGRVMDWLAEKRIQLNICPTSNVKLGRVKEMKEHPVGKLYRNGVRVTINTDDLAIFGQSVSQEYLNLYNAGVLTAEELESIRLTGLEGLGAG
jgi:adenosine deaminase